MLDFLIIFPKSLIDLNKLLDACIVIQHGSLNQIFLILILFYLGDTVSLTFAPNFFDNDFCMFIDVCIRKTIQDLWHF